MNGEIVSAIDEINITINRISYLKRDLKGIKSIVTKEQFESVTYKVGD